MLTHDSPFRLGDIVKTTIGYSGSTRQTIVGVVSRLSPQGNRVTMSAKGRENPLTFIRHSEGTFWLKNSTHYVRLFPATHQELEAYAAG